MYESKPYRLTASSFMLPHGGILENISDAATVGIEGLGLHLGRVDREGLTDDQVIDHFSAQGSRATFVLPRLWTILGVPASLAASEGAADVPSDPARRVEQIISDLPRLAQYNPVAVVIGSGTSGDPARPAGPIEAVASGLRDIATAADELGVTIAFELFGKRRGTPLPSLPQLVSFLDEVGNDNVKVSFDMFHSWPDENIHANLTRYADRIINVDVCDVKVHERSMFDRELPGRGRRVAPGLINALLDGGYEGWWKLEVFSDDGTYGDEFSDSYWKLPNDVLLRMAHAAFDGCFAGATTLGPPKTA